LRSRFTRFLGAITLIAALMYAYLALRLATGWVGAALIAIPVIWVWLVPILYWTGVRRDHTRFDDVFQAGSYVCMGWLNFVVILSLVRDALLLVSVQLPPITVLAGSLVALAIGLFWGMRGPAIVRVKLPIENLHPALEGLRIAQISDLHVGPTIGRRYASHVAEKALSLKADFYALTGDFVDGSVARLAPDIEPLRAIGATGAAYFCTGNHEYYSGAHEWIAHFASLGIRTLGNEHVILERGEARIALAGVHDPMGRHLGGGPDPQRAATGTESADLKILLAHNPRIAQRAASAGFDLQLSGHTHAGQFFPWNYAVKRVHAPHFAGLSREGRMWVYVSAGTGSWGPPMRFGTRTEVTLLELVRAGSDR
jgi:predicted MPP superfamily phosphohydrolase